MELHREPYTHTHTHTPLLTGKPSGSMCVGGLGCVIAAVCYKSLGLFKGPTGNNEGLDTQAFICIFVLNKSGVPSCEKQTCSRNLLQCVCVCVCVSVCVCDKYDVGEQSSTVPCLQEQGLLCHFCQSDKKHCRSHTHTHTHAHAHVYTQTHKLFLEQACIGLLFLSWDSVLTLEEGPGAFNHGGFQILFLSSIQLQPQGWDPCLWMGPLRMTVSVSWLGILRCVLASVWVCMCVGFLSPLSGAEPKSIPYTYNRIPREAHTWNPVVDTSESMYCVTFLNCS